MCLNRDKVKGLMDEQCAGNCNRFARELDIDPSQLYKYINTGVGGGIKVVLAIMKFCKEKDLDFDEYIEG
jgi:hypothetical protein